MGGAINWVWVDQARMTPAMAADFCDMAAEFRRVWGVDLLGTSGIRLDSEQEQIFRERYVPNSQVNGRRVYDRRWWNGTLWARISSAGTVAVSGASNHQLGYGRKGAVDLRDSGGDPGVTRFGTARNLWLRANAHRWGFDPDEGVAVNEAWHYRYTRDPYREAPNKETDDMTPEQDKMLRDLAADVAWLKDRVGGSVKTAPSLHEQIKAGVSKLAADVTWLKDRVGGSVKTSPSITDQLRGIKTDPADDATPDA